MAKPVEANSSHHIDRLICASSKHVEYRHITLTFPGFDFALTFQDHLNTARMKRLCKRCEGFSVDWPLPHPRRRHQHHGSLAALKSCAESGACALCHLLWVGAKKLLQRVDPGLIPTYLSRWPQDSRLFIVDSKDLRQNVHHPLTLVKGPASSDGREGSKEELLGRFHITAEPGMSSHGYS